MIGVNAHIEELHVLPKYVLHELSQPRFNIVHPMIQTIEDNIGTHVILHVTLGNGEAYVLDLTGAQYGHYDETVLPW